MSKTTTISGTISQTVVLGASGVGSTLTVTDTGFILPVYTSGVASTYGNAGIDVRARLVDASVTNMGIVAGGAGGMPYGGATYRNGGVGIDVLGASTSINNGGLVSGGVGAYVGTFYTMTTPNGGIGIDLASAGGVLTNSGTINGGVGGGTSGQPAGTGGIGVDVTAAADISNSGTIHGGRGGYAFSGHGGNGGDGVDLRASGDRLVNSGNVAGGVGGSGGYGVNGPYPFGMTGTGVDMSAGTYLSNTGTVTGEIGVNAVGSAIIVNAGAIYSFGGASAGVELGKGAELTNTQSGTIGGSAGYAVNLGHYHYDYVAGGAGLDALSPAAITNQGIIFGGSGYFDASDSGCGIILHAGGTLQNTGLIEGGGAGFEAGAGVESTNAVVTNSGVISGGYGYRGGGLYMAGGSALNTGTIRSGSGSLANTRIGVGLDHATLTNAGTISGGSYAVTAADGSTLIIDPGAVFNGAVVATDSGDTLQLAGTSAGSLSGLGSAFAHFSFIAENAHADWTLTGSNVLAAGESLSDAGVLTVTGSLTDAAAASIKAGGEVTASGGGTILIDGVTLAGGVLTGSASGSIAIGLDPAGASGSRITVESGAFIGGFGAVNGAGVIDDGTVIARAGTLTVGVPISGTGALDIANGATLRTGGAVSVTNVHFNQGSGETLYVAKPTALSSRIAGFCRE